MKRAALASIVALASFTALASNRPAAPTNLGILLFAAPNGSAANSGFTTNSPWPLSYALAQASSSAIITLLPGTYPSIEIGHSGTKLVSQVKWAAKVVGSLGAPGIGVDPNVGNVTIDGIEVASSALDGISLQGSNCVVRNCWIHDSAGNGVSARSNSGALIERNLIEYNGTAPAGGLGIRMSGTNCIVRANVIRDNQGWGCQFYEPPPISSAECNFYDNLVYGNGGGLSVWSPAGQTNYVFNNTILSPTNYCLMAGYGNLHVTNNILVVGGGLPVIAVADGATVWSDYNLVNASTSPGGDHDVLTADPGFVNAVAGLYWLTAVSPARGAANLTVIPPVDFFGNRQTTVSDIGAVQFNSALAADTRVLDPSATNGADYWAQLGGGGTAPSITAQPQNQTVIAGQSATFTVAATGSSPLSYQWTFNGLNVASASSTYTRTNCQLADDGAAVRVTVSNGSGLAQSGPANLTVNPLGTNYYVATNGVSSNTGLSPDSAWPMQYGLNQLGPGITVVVLPGVYTGPFHVYYSNGTATNPAIVRSQYKWQAVIANSAARGMEVWSAQYIILDGLCVSNSVSDGIMVLDSNDTVRNCWITHNGNLIDESGIGSDSLGTSNNVFEYSLIEFNGSGAGLGHGIYVSGQNNIIRGNVVRHNGGFGIHLYTGFAGNPENNNFAYDNLVYGNTNWYGVTIWSADGNGLLPGTNYLFSNTILDGVELSYGTDCVTNNIILASPQNPSLPIAAAYNRVPMVYADYNLSSLALVPAGSNDVIVNTVGFVNPGTGLYWLSSNSSARGAANHNVVPPADFFANPQTLVNDIGAFQYNAILTGDLRVLDPSPANPDYWSPP